MTYKNIKEIKKIFGMDLSEKNRTIPYVTFRTLYAVEKLNEFHITEVAKELKINRTSVYHCVKNYDEQCKTELFKAFKTKDKSILDKYHAEQKEKQNNYSKESKNREVISTFVEAPRLKKPKHKTLSNLKLAEFLRINKMFKHEAWNIPIKNISPNQWKDIRSIDKKMFDRL